MTNTLQAALIIYFYPERWMDEGHSAGAAELKAHAEHKIGGFLDQLDEELAHQGPNLVDLQLLILLTLANGTPVIAMDTLVAPPGTVPLQTFIAPDNGNGSAAAFSHWYNVTAGAPPPVDVPERTPPPGPLDFTS